MRGSSGRVLRMLRLSQRARSRMSRCEPRWLVGGGKAPLKPQTTGGSLRDLHVDWPRCFLISVSSQLVKTAGDVADHHRLRAYDAVHLATGLAIKTEAAEPVTFACWDRSLAYATRKAGLKPFPAIA